MSDTDTFKAVTWNLEHGTPPAVTERVLTGLLAEGVSVFLIQEATQAGFLKMLRRHGLRAVFHAPEFVVAWKPEKWTKVAHKAHELSPIEYPIGGGRFRKSRAVSAILCDRQGRTIHALSYHTPSMVQRGEPNPEVPNRVRALRESMRALKALADRQETRAILYGGDDNVDERNGKGWDFMLRPATGLRQIVAPRGTHGNRKIDDFRVRGLAPVGSGTVRDGGGDHKAHIHKFRWL